MKKTEVPGVEVSKLAPVMVTVAPTSPLVGLKPVICGKAEESEGGILESVPPPPPPPQPANTEKINKIIDRVRKRLRI
jgi:hypothetical protein